MPSSVLQCLTKFLRVHNDRMLENQMKLVSQMKYSDFRTYRCART